VPVRLPSRQCPLPGEHGNNFPQKKPKKSEAKINPFVQSHCTHLIFTTAKGLRLGVV
jgi:hypothetical protein